MKTLISNATIVNEGRSSHGSVVIEDDIIKDIILGDETAPKDAFDHTVDASGCFLLPGVIDSHVHFREPGLTHKADILSESRAAAYGGVTSYFDMPNTIPQTTTLAELDRKRAIAQRDSSVNYAFFFGATNENANLFHELDIHRTPGIKLFMGSSTGNMLVDSGEALDKIFQTAPLPIMTHCEDTSIINRNMLAAKEQYGDDPAVVHHSKIRSEEACYVSTELAVKLAKKYNARLHVAHLTTARELSLFKPWTDERPGITAEAVIAHLYFSDNDYLRLGAMIKCNPSVKTSADRNALKAALSDGRIATVSTDHAPHLMTEKQGGCVRAASGMPMVQFSLVTMLELVDNGTLTLERLVELMCHHPAQLFDVQRRGFIRRSYKADLTIVRPRSPWSVTKDCIQSKCGWSPMMGHTFNWRVVHTFCNGQHVLDDGKFDNRCRGEEILFR